MSITSLSPLLWKTLERDIIPLILNPLIRRRLSTTSVSQAEYDEHTVKIQFTPKLIAKYICETNPDRIVVYDESRTGNGCESRSLYLFREGPEGEYGRRKFTYHYDISTMTRGDLSYGSDHLPEIKPEDLYENVDMKTWLNIQTLRGISKPYIKKIASDMLDDIENDPDGNDARFQVILNMAIIGKEQLNDTTYSFYCFQACIGTRIWDIQKEIVHEGLRRLVTEF